MYRAILILIITCFYALPVQAQKVAIPIDSTVDTDDNYSDPFDKKDPIEPINRQIFDFNLAFDRYVMRPIDDVYKEFPRWSRLSVDNFLTNLSEPSNAVNGLLQLNPKIAFTSSWRFMLNSTFGLAGFNDFASHNGLKNMDTDFGKTLGRYHVPEGAYVVLPLVGPSSVRDTAGKCVDWFLDPVGWYMNTPESIAQVAANSVDTRNQQAPIINQFYYQSLEPYSATRAAYLQNQAFQFRGGRP